MPGFALLVEVNSLPVRRRLQSALFVVINASTLDTKDKSGQLLTAL